MDEFEEELKRDFLKEATDLLSEAENAFLRLEKNKEDTSILDEIFRLAHNLKGTSMAVGFGQLSELTHTAENLILKLKEGSLEITDHVVTVLLEFLDQVNIMVEGLDNDLDASFDIGQILQKLKDTTENKGSIEPTEVKTEPVETEPVVEENVEDNSQVEFSGIEIPEGEMLTDIEQVQELIKKQEAAKTQAEANPVEEKPSLVSTPEVEKPKAPAKKAKESPKKKEDESIRVSLNRIAKLNDIVGELVILQTVLDQRRFEHIKDELSNKSISQMGKLFKEVQEVSMSLRMIPLKNTFQKMARIVRDTSRTLNKKVDLNLVGENTEVDKTVLEYLADPLVHIVRNAIDHGLETPEGRLENGKQEAGQVEIMAFHEGSNLVIQVTDDGKGIDPDIIRKKAIEKGLINEADEISPTDMIQYIFHPGFSTKEQVSDVSGRGVGMDVVKTNIENMSGEVKVMSKLKQGSSFKIVLPLTLAIIDGMVTRASETRFIIPLSQAHEFVSIDEKNLVHSVSLGQCLKIRGDILPLFDLSKTLNLRSKTQEINPNKIAIIVKNSGKAFAVEFDEIINQQQVVIKNLGEEIKNKKGFMGSSILGDGCPAFIIDLVDLYIDQIKIRNKQKEYRESA